MEKEGVGSMAGNKEGVVEGGGNQPISCEK